MACTTDPDAEGVAHEEGLLTDGGRAVCKEASSSADPAARRGSKRSSSLMDDANKAEGKIRKVLAGGVNISHDKILVTLGKAKTKARTTSSNHLSKAKIQGQGVEWSVRQLDKQTEHWIHKQVDELKT